MAEQGERNSRFVTAFEKAIARFRQLFYLCQSSSTVSANATDSGAAVSYAIDAVPRSES